MHDDQQSPMTAKVARLSDDPALMWRYLGAQWRRAFGLNVSRIDDLLFVGGQFRPRQWAALRALGIRAVLSLQAERQDRFSGPPPERTLRLLVPDFHPPEIGQLHEAVAFLRATHADRLPVLVHCHAGVGRAPLTAAAYLVSEGLSAHAALERIRQARPIIGLAPTQLARLHEWEQLLQS